MGFISDISEEDALLRARIDDACHLCELRSCPRFVGFLDEHRQAVARAVLHEKGVSHFLFWGGHEQAERVILGVFPSFLPVETDVFPLTALCFRYRAVAALTHRDFLGTLLAAGIKRDVIGDIVCQQGQTVVFVTEDVAPLLAETVSKVGGEGVRCEYPYTGAVSVVRAFREWQETVASPRLDAVLKAALHVSREEAARKIESGAVSLNHMPALSVAVKVTSGDVLSVRGAGRFSVQLGSLTKKGRQGVTIRKYI